MAMLLEHLLVIVGRRSHNQDIGRPVRSGRTAVHRLHHNLCQSDPTQPECV